MVMKRLMNTISFAISEPRHSVSIRVYKLGDVSDKLCVFPADES